MDQTMNKSSKFVKKRVGPITQKLLAIFLRYLEGGQLPSVQELTNAKFKFANLSHWKNRRPRNLRRVPNFSDISISNNHNSKSNIDSKRSDPVSDSVTAEESCKSVTNSKEASTKMLERFRAWARRMKVSDSKLLYANTGKEIIPKEDFPNVVMSVHCNLSTHHKDELGIQGHCSLGQTVTIMKKKYSVGRRQFGISEKAIKRIVALCPVPKCSARLHSQKEDADQSLHLDSDEGTVSEDVSSADALTPRTASWLEHVSQKSSNTPEHILPVSLSSPSLRRSPSHTTSFAMEDLKSPPGKIQRSQKYMKILPVPYFDVKTAHDLSSNLPHTDCKSLVSEEDPRSATLSEEPLNLSLHPTLANTLKQTHVSEEEAGKHHKDGHPTTKRCSHSPPSDVSPHKAPRLFTGSLPQPSQPSHVVLTSPSTVYITSAPSTSSFSSLDIARQTLRSKLDESANSPSPPSCSRAMVKKNPNMDPARHTLIAKLQERFHCMRREAELKYGTYANSVLKAGRKEDDGHSSVILNPEPEKVVSLTSEDQNRSSQTEVYETEPEVSSVADPSTIAALPNTTSQETVEHAASPSDDPAGALEGSMSASAQRDETLQTVVVASTPGDTSSLGQWAHFMSVVSEMAPQVRRLYMLQESDYASVESLLNEATAIVTKCKELVSTKLH